MAVLVAGCRAPAPAGSREWPVYGGTAAGTRYSPLAQVTRDNVGQLAVAWTFDTGETGGFQVNPIVVDGVLYANTPTHKAIALDAATGALRWRFDSGTEGKGPNRGVTFWAQGADRRIFTAVEQFLYALDAGTGRPVESFGDSGRIDLRNDLDRDPALQSVRLTSPPVVYEDLLIVGGRVSEGDGASPGHVRAYDAKTGRLRWRFNTIPRPGEPGHDTWPPDAWKTIGGAKTGPAWPWTKRAVSSSFRRAWPHRISTAPAGSATTSTRIACSPWMRRPASASGTSSSCATTSGIATRRHHPRS